jgi:RHS repeat-associated protein
MFRAEVGVRSVSQRHPWSWRARFAAVVAAIVVTVTGVPASADDVSPSPTPSVEPTPSAETSPSAEPATPEEGVGSTDEEDPGAQLADALDGFGDVSPDEQVSVASQKLQGPDIDDAETSTGARDSVETIVPGSDTFEVDGEKQDALVRGLESVSLQEAVTSALGGDIEVPDDTMLRGDLLGNEYDRASAGDTFEVETIPLADGDVPGAAFALRLRAHDEDADAQWVGLDLDISGIRYAHGGDYGGRLTLMVFPECVLTTPEDPSCATGVPISSENVNGEALTGVVPADAGEGPRLEGVSGFGSFRSTKVRATDLLASTAAAQGLAMNTSTGQGTIVAAVSGVAGPSGTFAKTDLKPTGAWAVGGQSGAFTYSVPLEVPPVEAGPVPDVTLSYNSQVIDGHTPASNGQSSWIADGWDLEFGYIERQFNSCTAEGFGTQGVTMATGWSGYSKVYAPGDFNNDGFNDIIAVTSAGVATLFYGDGAGGLDAGRQLGTGWNSFSTIVFPGKFNADGNVDMITRTSNGDFWLYRGDGDQGWIDAANPWKIGVGWNVFVEIIAPGDFSGDGKPDVIGRDSSGNLKLYRGDGTGWFYSGNTQIGVGFNAFSRHITVGDFTGDTFVDVIGVWPNGTPEIYKGNGNSYWLNGNGAAVSGPWSSATNLVGSPDLNGDGRSDLVELSGGTLRVFLGTGTGHGQTGKGNDLCWARAIDPKDYTVGENEALTLNPEEQASYVMSLGGASYQLFPVGGNRYITSPDTGIVIERRTRGANTNGDDDGEYFRVWTPDGGVYYFGYGHSATSVPTNSVATVQAWANDTGPSCTGTCQQAYRWMLDLQVDSSKNAMAIYYTKESNKYSQSGTTTYNTYTSAIYPKSIEYGGRMDGTWNAPSVSGTTAKVDFILTGRCVQNTIADHSRAPVTSGVIGGCPTPIASNASSYPDVPSDLICTGSTCNTSTQRTPAFFKQMRLARVDTSVKVGSTWTKVAAHTLYATFPLPAGSDGRTLWLDGVFTRYLGEEVGTTDAEKAADDLVTYAISFDGALMNNRVDWTTDAGKLQKRRITGIRNEFGGYVQVNYNRQQTPGTDGGACTLLGRTNAKPSDAATATWYRDNKWECYRVKASDGNYGLYHRYLVSSVDLIDAVANQPTQRFTYTYGQTPTSRPLWAYADSIIYRRNATDVDRQDFNVFLGYPIVTVSLGDDPDTAAVEVQSSTTTYYHQGASGAWNGDAATVASGLPQVVDLPSGTDPEDYPALRGMPALVETFDALGRVTSSTRYTYNVVTRADGPYHHDATVVQTPLVTSTSTEWGAGSAQSRTSSVATTYDVSNPAAPADHPWLPVATVTTPDTSDPTANLSRTTTRYTFEDTAYNAFSEWNSTTPVPFFHLPIAGSSEFGDGTEWIITGEWETSYLEPNNVMRGLPVLERQRVTPGDDPDDWLKSTAEYDALGRITKALGPAETVNNTEVTWAYTLEGEFRKVQVTNQVGWVTSQWFEPRFGNLVKSEDANGDFTHYVYDNGGLLTEGWSPRENAREDDGSGTSVKSDVPIVAASSREPDHPTVPTVSYRYDVYGSVLSVRTEPVVVVSAQFAGWDVDDSVWRALPEAGFVRRSYEFLDGFGRPIESHTVAPDGSGKRLVTQTAYDELGRAFRVSEPYWDDAVAQAASGVKSGVWDTGAVSARIPRFSETVFDASGRVESTSLVVAAGGVQSVKLLTSIAYALDAVTTTQETTGASTVVETDVLGRTVKQTQCAPTGCAGAPDIVTQYQYQVTAAGSIVTVIDDAQRPTVFESDLGGRRTKLTDPNSGVSTYAYNASGQVSQIQSATGTVSLTYDHLGRMTERESVGPDGTTVSSSAQWEYVDTGETGAPADLGLLRSESATTVIPGFTEAFTVKKVFDYNALHQVESTTVQLPESDFLGDLSNVDYVTEVEYDATGAAYESVHDAVGGLPEQTMTTGLDLLGRSRTLTVADTADTRTLVKAVTFDALGRLNSRTYGNDVVRGYTWDPLWGSLKTASASFEDAGTVTIQADAYSRDSAGRVTAVRDAVAGVSQCYTYDGFNRLESAWTDTRTSLTCTGGVTAAVQPLAPLQDLGYALEYDYESTGEVHTITDLLASSNQTSTYAYTDTSSPNAVTAVTGGASSSSYTYDAAGRMTTRSAGGGAAGLIWDVSSNLVATTQTGQDRVYLYDAGGQRVAQLKVGSLASPSPQSATVYLGATEATDANTALGVTGDVTATRFYTFGGATVATATAATGGPVSWALLFGDIQGSAQVSMELETDTGESSGFEPASELDHAVTRNAYQPYGSRRGTDALTVDRGWLGQTEDTDTALTYLNARYYDPVLGRFLSPDPLMNPGDPRTLDPYRYADNNPVVFTDPSGLCSTCDPSELASIYGGGPSVYGNPLVPKGAPTSAPPNGGGGGGGGGDLKLPLPDNVCYQFGSPCWPGSDQAKLYQDQQALRGNFINPWANVTCYPEEGNRCDSGGMYHSAPPASAQEVYALSLFMLAYVGGMACLAMLPECALGASEFFATGGAGMGLTVGGAGASTAATSAAALETRFGSAPARFITTAAGVTVDRASVEMVISLQRQSRHILGNRAYAGGGYFESFDDATMVLDAFHNGNAQLLGVSSSGNIVVRVPGVAGFNNNPGAGFVNQPTDVFMIKGTSSVSVVPISPKWVP